MTWTYSGNPANSDLDAIRFEIGDTDTTDQLLSNEEINYLITEYGSTRHCASQACMAIAAKFARLMNRSIGGLSADFAAKYRHYVELAEKIASDEQSYPVSPYLSGYKISAKKAVEDDADREPTFSRKGIMDNNRAYPADNEGWTDYRRSG